MSILLSAELEVDGDLKVTGTVDANGNPITNVGAPLLSTDAVNAGYVLTATAGRGRIIMVKCGWSTSASSHIEPSIGSCEPPECPDGWNNLITFNEVTAASGAYGNTNYGKNIAYGNTVRYCMAQEDQE